MSKIFICRWKFEKRGRRLDAAMRNMKEEIDKWINQNFEDWT